MLLKAGVEEKVSSSEANADMGCRLASEGPGAFGVNGSWLVRVRVINPPADRKSLFWPLPGRRFHVGYGA